MSRRIENIDINNLINEYLSGKSAKRIAIENGFSRQVVYRIFRENNIVPRDRSGAMYARMAQTSADERKRLAHAAHVAKRGKKNTPEMLHRRALAHKRRIGMFEQEFIDAISKHGFDVVPQEPFLSYNLDIGCGNIAVEIHTQTASPLAAKHCEKLMNCVNSGKSMIYVWIDPRRPNLTPQCYENVIRTLEEFRSNPPSRSKYWVIRSTGELYATGSFD